MSVQRAPKRKMTTPQGARIDTGKWELIVQQRLVDDTGERNVMDRCVAILEAFVCAEMVWMLRRLDMVHQWAAVVRASSRSAGVPRGCAARA
jgi:hypothetical protein